MGYTLAQRLMRKARPTASEANASNPIVRRANQRRAVLRDVPAWEIEVPSAHSDADIFGNGHSYAYGHLAPGFTLVELMIVLAIVGILVAIAVPSYYGYVARAQFSEGLNLTNGMKTAVANAYQNRKKLTGIDNGVESVPAAAASQGTYISAVVVRDGVITARFASDSALANKSVTLIPTETKGALAWRCTTTADFSKAPASCRSKTPDQLNSDEIPIDDGTP